LVSIHYQRQYIMNTRFLIFTVFVLAFVATTCMGRSLSNGKDKKQMATRNLKGGLKRGAVGSFLQKRSFNVRSYKAALLAKRHGDEGCPDGLVEIDKGLCACAITNDPDVDDEIKCREGRDQECPDGYSGGVLDFGDEDRRRRDEDSESSESSESSEDEDRRRRGESSESSEDWEDSEDEDEDSEDWEDSEDEDEDSEDEDEDEDSEDRDDEERRRRGESEDEDGDAALFCQEDESEEYEDRRKK